MGGKWKSIPFTAQDTQLQHIVLMALLDDIHVICGEKTASLLTIITPIGYRQSQTDKWSTLRIIIRVTMYRFNADLFCFKDIPAFGLQRRLNNYFRDSVFSFVLLSCTHLLGVERGNRDVAVKTFSFSQRNITTT